MGFICLILGKSATIPSYENFISGSVEMYGDCSAKGEKLLADISVNTGSKNSLKQVAIREHYVTSSSLTTISRTLVIV